MYVSAQYLVELQYQHSVSEWGVAGVASVPEIHSYCSAHGLSTILDYGSGQGLTAAALTKLGYTVAEYEPGIAAKSHMPKPAAVVVCTDVMEHVELEYVDSVLAHISSLAQVSAFFTISCRPAGRLLSDGRNAHITLESSAWWWRKLESHWSTVAGDCNPCSVIAWCRN